MRSQYAGCRADRAGDPGAVRRDRRGIADVNLVFFVVLTSTLLQGTAVLPLLRRLGLKGDASPGRSLVEALPLEDAHLDIIEVTLDRSSPLVDRELRSCAPPEALLVAAIVRGGKVILPRGSTRRREDDQLVITTADRTTGMVAAQEWVDDVTASVEVP